MPANDFLLIGKIIGAHGIKGVLKVFSYAESPGIFQPGDSIFLQEGKGASAHTIQWVQPHRQVLRMALVGIEDRDQAEKRIGAKLFIEKAILPEPETGVYYWFDLIGLTVKQINGQTLGRLASIFPTGSNDVYVVKNSSDPGNGELLIPAIESVIVRVDMPAGIMWVDLPEGLE
jgi:16S rRNA processing protein RimM